jgi:hypothetical protein
LGVDASVTQPRVVLYKAGQSGLTLITKNASGVSGDAFYSIEDPLPRGAVSGDGRIVAFVDKATNLVSPPTAGLMQVYVKGLGVSASDPILVSKTAEGVESDGECASPVLGAGSFASTTPFVAFSSQATNIALPAEDGTADRIFSSTISLPAPPITKNYQIPVPPEAVVSRRRVTFTFLRFSAAQPAGVVREEAAEFAASATKVTYTLSVRGVGNSTRITRTSNRNRITISRLNPGTYTARYKATRTSSRGRSVSTRNSPSRTFKVT